MDYIREDECILKGSTGNGREQQIDRLMAYAMLFNTRLQNEINKLNKDVQQVKFWSKESDLEQKIYKNLKKWEARHPIIGIILCTILGGILISLIAGIILEAGINFFYKVF